MTRSERRECRAREALERIAKAMGEQVMARLIDEPIDQAFERYLATHEVPADRREFLVATAGLVQSLCQAESGSGAELSLETAKDETVFLLDSGYRGIYVDGYEGAIIDVGEGKELVPRLIWQYLANAIKMRRRVRYLAAVKAELLDSLDWDTQLAIAEIVISRCGAFLPAPLRSLPCEVVVDEVFNLLLTDRASDDGLRHTLQGPW